MSSCIKNHSYVVLFILTVNLTIFSFFFSDILVISLFIYLGDTQLAFSLFNAFNKQFPDRITFKEYAAGVGKVFCSSKHHIKLWSSSICFSLLFISINIYIFHTIGKIAKGSKEQRLECKLSYFLPPSHFIPHFSPYPLFAYLLCSSSICLPFF